MNEFEAAWRDDWIGAVHIPSNQTFGFMIEEHSDGTLRLTGGVVFGSYSGSFNKGLHDLAMLFARGEVEKRFGKPVSP